MGKSTLGRKEDLLILLARGYNTTEAATSLGITKDSLNTWCRRTGNMDLYNKFPKKKRGYQKKWY